MEKSLVGKLILINYYTCRKTDQTGSVHNMENKLDFQNIALCSVQGIGL